MPPGFLAVFSEPGYNVTLEEFQDWYDNEHVPLRLNHLHEFLSGARYTSYDAQKPSWAAFYEIDDTTSFEKERYTRLRAHRSIREAQLIKRLECLDRRTGEVVKDSDEGSVSLSLGKAGEGVVTIAVKDESGWEEGAGEGWIRSRLVKVIDSAVSGVGGEGKEVPGFLVVHGFKDKRSTDAFVERLGKKEEREVRKWGLYRAYPGIAQGNVKDAITEKWDAGRENAHCK